MFLYAYREFIRALSIHDMSSLKKMTEPSLFKKISENSKKVKELNCQYFCVQNDIKMKMRLLDMQMI